MSTSSVSSLGSAEISSQLSTVEARLDAPIKTLESQSSTDTATISAWGTVQGVLSTLNSSLSGIKDPSSINDRTASTSSSAVATISATSSAAVATYNLTDVTLAKSQEIYTGVQTSASAALGSGTLTFNLQSGKSETVSVGSGSSSLNSIAAAINALGGGVQASVVGTSGGARLTFESSSTGSSQAFSIAGTGALAKFSYSSGSTGGSLTVASTAKNATFKLNGVPVSDATNTITTAVTGVTISLAGSSTTTTSSGVTTSGTTTLTVSASTSGLTSALSSVTTNLNAAIAKIAKETAYTPASSATASASATAASAGPLLGSFTASNIEDQLLSSVSGAAASGLSANSIGLTVGTGGAVSFSSSTFAAAYASNPTGVTALISQIYTNLKGVTTGALGSAGSTTGSGASAVTVATTSSNQGSIYAVTNGLKSDVESIASEEAQITTENNAQLQILIDQYTTAESAASTAEITEEYLSAFTSSSSTSS